MTLAPVVKPQLTRLSCFRARASLRAQPLQLDVGGAASLAMPRDAQVLVLRGDDEPWVLERLRVCFRHSFQEVMARLEGLERVFEDRPVSGEAVKLCGFRA